MRVVKINKGKVMPWQFRFFGVIIALLICIGTLQLQPQFLAISTTILCSMLAPAIWFASNIITIDLENQELHDGVWTLGKRFGKPIKFNSIEKFFINRVKTSQTMYSIANNQNISRNIEFKVFVKLDNGDKYFLFSHPLEERAEEKLNEVKNKLGFIN